MSHESDDKEFEPEGRGRAKRKREVRTFDVMALELLEIPENKCSKLPVTDKLKTGLREARETKSKSARRRHIRHLASLLRDSPSEVEAIRNFLSGVAYVEVSGDEEYRELDGLRAGLCEQERFAATLDEVTRRLPHVDLALVTRLAKSFHGEESDKTHRALFRELRRAADESERDSD